MVDWREGKTALECHRYMLKEEIECDVIFEVGLDGGQTEIIGAHKYMLAARSPVFFSMFYGELKENGNIRVTDIEPDNFRHMLKYIYLEEMELIPGNILTQLTACDKYLLPAIPNILQEKIDNQTACEIWEWSEQNNCTEVAAKARQHILEKFTDIRSSPQFLNLPQRLLYELLSSDALVVSSEEDVFNSCLLWAQHQRTKEELENLTTRSVLRECVYAIRFPLMSHATFVKLMEAEPGFLSAEEENVILKFNVTGKAALFTGVKRNSLHTPVTTYGTVFFGRK